MAEGQQRTSYVVDTARRKQIVLLAVVATAAALVIGTLMFLFADDDQNPIRVRNKRLRIETEDKDAKWVKEGPTEKWKLSVRNRKETTEYFVTAYGANPGCTGVLRGTEVDIRYEVPGSSAEPQVQTFAFRIQLSGKLQPVLEASTPMTEETAGKVKRLRRTSDGRGAITALTVRDGSAPGECTFPQDRRVAVELCFHACEVE